MIDVKHGNRDRGVIADCAGDFPGGFTLPGGGVEQAGPGVGPRGAHQPRMQQGALRQDHQGQGAEQDKELRAAGYAERADLSASTAALSPVSSGWHFARPTPLADVHP